MLCLTANVSLAEFVGHSFRGSSHRSDLFLMITVAPKTSSGQALYKHVRVPSLYVINILTVAFVSTDIYDDISSNR